MAEPLQKLKDGMPYQRPVEIEAQIDELSLLSRDEIVARARIRSSRDPNYIASECLLYFLRGTRKDNSERHFNRLFEALWQRVQDALPNDSESPALQHANEEVELRLMEMLVKDRQEYQERLDFFEVRFGFAMKAMRYSALRKMYREEAHEVVGYDESELQGDAKKSGSPFLPFTSEKLSDPLYRMRLSEAIRSLPDEQRQALALWQKDIPYTSQDPNVVTAGAILGCSEQTARNRRDRAIRALRTMLEGEEQ